MDTFYDEVIKELKKHGKTLDDVLFVEVGHLAMKLTPKAFAKKAQAITMTKDVEEDLVRPIVIVGDTWCLDRTMPSPGNVLWELCTVIKEPVNNDPRAELLYSKMGLKTVRLENAVSDSM